MADSSRSQRFPWWVTGLDALACVLLVLAAWVFITDTGPVFRIGGFKFQATSELRLTVWAALLVSVRHLVFRGETLWHRIRRSVMRQWTSGTPLAPDEFLEHAGTATIGARELGLVAILMVALTAAITYPQIAHLDAVSDLGDPLFSIWRLKWIAHQLPRDPPHLFDANIFYPARYTLALSDSILLPGFVAAPLLWLGVPDVALYNFFLLATFVLAGVAMYVLIRHLTASASAALVSGVGFAFYPFRFEHYSHFELQFSFWMPLVLLALHRTLAYGRLRDGLLTGAALGGQMLSSLYLGLFLCAYLVPVGGAMALGWRRIRPSVKPLMAGVAVAVLLVAPLVSPYLHVHRTYGERGRNEMEFYSARPEHYLMPHSTRTTYANGVGPIGREAHELEKDLFPGILLVALALVAVWPPLSASRIAYTLGLLFAFEASLGTHGYSFPMLVEHVLPFRGLRVPARFSMLVGLSLSILAGLAVARLEMHLRRQTLKYVLAVVLVAIVLFESRTTLALEHVPEPHVVYHWFDGAPPTVIAELPAPKPTAEFLWSDVRYSYPATFHWQRMLNGNSGTYPTTHIEFCAAMQTFPDNASIALLQKRGVEYVIVHEEYYGRATYQSVVGAIEERRELQEVVRAVSGGYEARIYRVVR
jgi:hypothetical protein